MLRMVLTPLNTIKHLPLPGRPFKRQRVSEPDSELARAMLFDVSRGDPCSWLTYVEIGPFECKLFHQKRVGVIVCT